MKGKRNKIITVLLSLVCVLALSLTAFACGGGGDTKTIAYTGAVLNEATLNKAYTASVATATGADGITYSVKSGKLPDGLSLSAAGEITGTPTAAVENAEFSVEAKADGATSATATFTLTVLASGGTVTFEAEYVDLDGVKGGLISGSVGGVNMIIASEGASNGHYVGGTHKTGVEFKFVVNATAAGKATVKLSLGTELGPITMKPSVFQLKVGTKTINYKEFKIAAGPSSAPVFHTYTLSPEIDLAAGDNVITFTVLANELCNGSSGGPMFDCMYISSTVDLTWTPKTENLE